jgi:chemotaxis response regulator CheB
VTESVAEDVRPVRVVIVDDHVVIRTAYADILNSQPDLTVVGTASDGARGVELCREVLPDVVLMDIRMHGASRMNHWPRASSASQP